MMLQMFPVRPGPPAPSRHGRRRPRALLLPPGAVAADDGLRRRGEGGRGRRQLERGGTNQRGAVLPPAQETGREEEYAFA